MRVFAASALAIVACLALAGRAQGQSEATPTPSPSPTPTIAPGHIRLQTELFSYGLDQRYTGPGIVPPEGVGFAQGSPVSPGTPYDFFNSAPITPGFAFGSGMTLDAFLGGKNLDFGLRLGAQVLAGSATGNAYWGEPPIPTLDPHISANRFTAPVVFPTGEGQDNASVTRASILSAELASKDRSMRVRAGWFDLIQTDGFVFAPIPRPNAAPTLATTLAESQGSGPPALDLWKIANPSLPLQGADFYAERGPWSFEATDAALPQSPGTDTRLTMASLVFSRDELRFSAQYAHATSGGATIATTTFYGTEPTVWPSTQGPIVTSNLAGQRQTILGLRAAVPFAEGQAVAEYGRATYDTTLSARPGTNRPGTWVHLQYGHPTGIIDWTADFYRFEPRYATMILPYGTAENVWSVAYTWPGPWLKGTYQLVDTTAVGINREGVRLRAAIVDRLFEAKVVASVFHQIEPIDVAHATLEGWVEGFYLPQFAGTPTLGQQKQYGAWLAYHPALADLTFEWLEDSQHRDAAAPLGVDAVSLRFPQWTFNMSRRIGRSLVSAGLARYGLYGNFSAAAINADLRQRVAYVGAQYRQSDALQTQLTWRWYSAAGIPITAGGALPDMHGGQIFLEQRLRL